MATIDAGLALCRPLETRHQLPLRPTERNCTVTIDGTAVVEERRLVDAD